MRDLLTNADRLRWDDVLFLPLARPWTLETPTLTVPSEEVDDNDSHPDAMSNAMTYAIGIADVHSIIRNIKSQAPDAGLELQLEALVYYLDNDAFLALRGRQL